MVNCKYFFIDNCGQGFTAPCCSMGHDINKCRSILCDVEYRTFVNCHGESCKCDIVDECIMENRMGLYDVTEEE